MESQPATLGPLEPMSHTPQTGREHMVLSLIPKTETEVGDKGNKGWAIGDKTRVK